jgi:serine/threonine protein kinase
MIAPGTQLGPYQILGTLGAGGMGEVYRARDSRLHREVAIKVLPEQLAEDDMQLARFEREAKAIAALSHPNILAIHDYAKEQGICFAVMELLEGETLRQRLTQAALPWRKALEIGVAISEGLAAAHAKGIIHRDLKPENIFLTSDGQVKILDFGLARLEKPQLPATSETAPYVPTQTDPGTVMGTVGYMSPEQVRAKTADARSDLFAFGCVLYEMVTGRRAFQRETAAETTTAILHDEPPELVDSGKKVPLEVQSVIRHCLEKNPEERFQSARDLAFDLRALASGSGFAGASPARARRRRRFVLGIAGMAVLGVVAGGLYYYFGPGRAIDSIAVLPFVNESGDRELEYLSDGITENVINNLSQLPYLRVIARSSVFRYKGKHPTPRWDGSLAFERC